MTLILNREHQTYNIAVILLFIMGSLLLPNLSSCKVYAKNSEQGFVVDYSKFDKQTVQKTADTLFESALNTQNPEDKSENLKNAAAQYYILSNIDKANSYSYIQLGRIYDMQKNDSYAKAYFYRALGIDSKSADGNFYFGDFYYSRNQFKKALIYYQKALKFGKENADMLVKIWKIYERFGDLPRANSYYQKSLELNPKNDELNLKIQQSQKIKEEYEKSGYYKRRLRN